MGKKKAFRQGDVGRGMHALARVYLLVAAADKRVVDMATLAILARNVLEQAINEDGPIALKVHGKREET